MLSYEITQRRSWHTHMSLGILCGLLLLFRLFDALHKTTHPTHLHRKFLGVTPLELVVHEDVKKTVRISDVSDSTVAAVCSAVCSVVRRGLSPCLAPLLHLAF